MPSKEFIHKYYSAKIYVPIGIALQYLQRVASSVRWEMSFYTGITDSDFIRRRNSTRISKDLVYDE